MPRFGGSTQRGVPARRLAQGPVSAHQACCPFPYPLQTGEGLAFRLCARRPICGRSAFQHFQVACLPAYGCSLPGPAEAPLPQQVDRRGGGFVHPEHCVPADLAGTFGPTASCSSPRAEGCTCPSCLCRRHSHPTPPPDLLVCTQQGLIKQLQVPGPPPRGFNTREKVNGE